MSDTKVTKGNLQEFAEKFHEKNKTLYFNKTDAGAEIAAATAAWLTEHVDPAGSAVVVDDSLSVEGAAADAKTVGDAIAEINGNLKALNPLVTTVNVVQGGIGSTNGSFVDASIAIRTSAPLDKNIIWGVTKGKYRLRAYCYTTDGQYLGYYYNGALYKVAYNDYHSDYLDFNEIYKLDFVDKIYLAVIKTGATLDSWLDITPAEIDNVTFYQEVNSIECNNSKAQVQCDVNALFDETPEIIQGNIDSYFGYYNETPPIGDGTDGSTRACTSQFFRMSDKNFITEVPEGYNCGLVLYTSAEFSSYVTLIPWSDSNVKKWNLTNDFNYIYFVFRKEDNSTIEDSDIEALNSGFKLTRLSDYSTRYFGKKMASLGDSITNGFIPRNYSGYPGHLNSFTKLTAQHFGMVYSNHGIDGSSVAYIADRNPMSRRYDDLPDDADVITFMGGTNDIRNGVTLGTSADRTDSTFYGALHVVLGGLYKKYFIDQGTEKGSNTKIIVITPLKLLLASAETIGGTGTLYDFEPWINAIKEVANYYSFPVLDMYNLSSINPAINETIQGWQDGYTGFYNPYITDGTHPTQEGAKLMSDILIGFLKSIN